MIEIHGPHGPGRIAARPGDPADEGLEAAVNTPTIELAAAVLPRVA